ncbi:MMPL family transporter [Endozoicomonas sp. G2_1]|uniref:efflux RND transporter permease subunit n=1 Tax=Endozoicomonas sp. G2_1 TaxID=2821091 RepID=UPI001ADD0966|nr:MMPL family transporter [Endozoicomonas sp. G2_1]MBO9491033.1 MMPL family transporter [Endozoicomonas sp. G2_1]
MKALWLKAIISHSWLTLILVLSFVIVSVIGAKNLYFRGDYKVFFERDNPQLVAFEKMQKIFSNNDNAAIIIAPKSGDIFNQKSLKLIKQLTDEAWQTPLSSRVDSITNYQHTWAEEDDLIVEDLLLDETSIDEQLIDRIARITISEPNLVKRLISDQGDVAVINITVQLPDASIPENAATAAQAVVEIADYIVALTDSYKEKYPDHNFYHTGVVYMNNAFITESKNDVMTLVPAMFLAIVAILWLMLRSIAATISTVLIIFTAIISTMGLAGWFGFFLSTATVNVPTVVMTLAVADCVHVISTMLLALSQGKSKSEAIGYSVEQNLTPIFITSATTAIGFLTLNFSNVPVIVDLGNLTALGIMIAFLFSVTLLPALLNLLPLKVKINNSNNKTKLNGIAYWVTRNHKKLLPTSVIIVIASLYFSTFNHINDVPTEYFDQSTDFRQATDFQQANVSGMSTIDFALYTEVESGINSPSTLKQIQSFATWLSAQSEVDHVATISDTFKRLNKNMHGDDQAYYQLPDSQELAAQYLLLYEMSLPYGLDLNNQLDIDKSATRITVILKNLGSKEFTEFEQRAKQWISANAPNITVDAASPALMFAHVGEKNMKSMLVGALVALIIISCLLVFALKSWKMGAISLLPNLIPAAIGFGIWAIYSAEINMGLSVVLSMTLGIIVDDTVHFLSKYQLAKKLGSSTEQSIHYAFNNVGYALWTTTVVLTIGFSVLAMSSFRLNADMGLLTAIIIVTALIVDFFFLPAFLMLLDKSKNKTQLEINRA